MTGLDLTRLRQTAIIQFRPYTNQVILWVMVALAFVTTNFASIAVEFAAGEMKPWTIGIAYASIVIFVLQLVIVTYFSSRKRAYKHQKLQSVFMCLFLLKGTVDFYLIYFIFCDVHNLGPQSFYIGFWLLLSGILFMIVRIILLIKGVRFKEHSSITEIDGQLVVSYHKIPNLIKILKCSLYIFLVFLLDLIVRVIGIDIEGYLLFLLFHAAFIQYAASKKLSNGVLIAYYKFKDPNFIFSSETYDNLKEERENVIHKGRIKLMVVKIVQYLAFFFLIYFILLDEIMEPSSGGIITIWGLCFFLHIKWMSKYNISFAGMYTINGMLSVITFISLTQLNVLLTGMNRFDGYEAIRLMFVSVVPLIFWWCFDYISFLRRNH